MNSSTRQCLLAGILATSAAPVFAQANAKNPGDTPEVLEEIVVTGVFIETEKRTAPLAISTLDAEDLKDQVPLSAADLLKAVPGVYVNSSLGEIRNIVYSRGVSAGSVEAASGYYYVSLQQDGLPVTNVTFTNYGPDYLYRNDLTLGRLEALRGGTASITGPNAPGGIFNYISRTGESHRGSEVQARYGLEGDGRNPFYRADFVSGGLIGTSNLSYSVGGFYRESDGARDPGYNMNRGGQLKGNLTYTYDQGTVQLYAKYLNDHNGWFEFLPANNFKNPKLVSGVSLYDSYLPPRARHSFTTDAGETTDTWDGSRLAHAKSKSVGVKWDHDLGNGWSFSNNLKYADNRVDWNTGALIFPVPVDDSSITSCSARSAHEAPAPTRSATAPRVQRWRRFSPRAVSIRRSSAMRYPTSR